MTVLASASFSRRSPAVHCAAYALAVQSPTPSVEPDGTAGRHRSRQVVTLRHDEHPVDAEDARGPGARVIGVAPGEVAHDGIRRNPVGGEPVTHGGGLVVAGDPVV